MLVKYTTPSTRLFESILDDLFEIPTVNKLAKTPIHDVIENEKEFQVEMLLAGLKKEDIGIDVDKDVLTIKAERKEVKDLKYNRKETYFGKYERSFVLPDTADKENINASLVDGVLKIIIPKLEGDVKLSKKTIEIT
jgi:HSP20 family protein